MSAAFRPYKPITHPPMRPATHDELVIGQWYKWRDGAGRLRTVTLRLLSECKRYGKLSIGARQRPLHDCATSSLQVWVNQCRPELGQKPKDTP